MSDPAEMRRERWENRAAMISQHTEQKRSKGMTQDERWMKRYQVVMAFIKSNHRNPSKHRIEEHDMLNWVKANRKAFNVGKLKPDRVDIFNRLLELMEQHKRVNQWK